MEDYMGEIRLFAGNFAPMGWLMCDGSSLSIQQYDVLFSLLGTTWGGDGQNTFNLPDMRGRIAIGSGDGSGLSPRNIGEMGGTEKVTLTKAQLPPHQHSLNASLVGATSATPGPGLVHATSATDVHHYNDVTQPLNPSATLAPTSIGMTGGGGAHDNMMATAAINYIICVEGIYPSP